MHTSENKDTDIYVCRYMHTHKHIYLRLHINKCTLSQHKKEFWVIVIHLISSIIIKEVLKYKWNAISVVKIDLGFIRDNYNFTN